MDVVRSSGGQAMPAKASKISGDVFENRECTSLFWLGNAGVLVLSGGTCLLLDPVLEGVESPLLFDLPITAAEIPKLDAVLITNSDGDHYSRQTCAALSGVCGRFCSNGFTAGIMRDDGLKSVAYGIGEQFSVNDIQVTLTPADHTWQSGLEAYSWREWKREDCCGFWLDTKDGCIWMPGD